MDVQVARGSERGIVEVTVDGVAWGRFEMFNHGPQGNSYILFQNGGCGVREPEARQSLKVYGDKLTKRLVLAKPWHRSDITVEQRIKIAAEYAVEKGLLRHPDAVKAERDEQYEAQARTRRAEVANQRTLDTGVGMQIADECMPSTGDAYTDELAKLKLASRIADAIEKGRTE